MSRKSAKRKVAYVKKQIREGATNTAAGKLVGGNTGRTR